MSKLTDALAASRDAFVAMGDTPAFSTERARAIANFYKTNIGLAKVLKGISVDDARATYEEFFGSQSAPSFDDVAAGSSSSSPAPEEPDEELWSNAVNDETMRQRRKRRRKPRDTYAEECDMYEILGVR